jgi:predicted metal-dependent phosphoesterase TrpH
MPSKGDFHTHSTASDGRLSPTELVDLVASQGVIYHALTDHDSTQGIAEARRAAAKHANYKLIPGVEMGTDIAGAEVHMLGLFLSPDDRELQGELKKLRDGRIGRGFGIVEKLRSMGIMVEWERVQQIAGDAPSAAPTSPRRSSRRATSRRLLTPSTSGSVVTVPPTWSATR